MDKQHLKRELGLLHATMMGVGGAICAGVFVTLGYAATLAGTALIIAMILCGIINLLTMLSYAELGAALPSAGGEYTFAKASFGGFVSFITGWFEFISNMFYASFSAVGFAYLISYVIPSINVPIVAVLAVVLFTAINVKGIKETGRIQTGMVILLLILLCIFIVSGLLTNRATGTLDLSAPEGFLGVLRASAFIFVVYLGGEAIAVAQAEIKEPGKTIPRAILLTCFILIFLYTAIAYVVFRIVPPSSLANQSSPLAFVAQQFMGEIGVGIVTVAGIIAALSSVNTSIMAQSRVTYAMARDGYFPKWFFSVHKRFSTPYVAVLAGSVLIVAFAATGVVNFVTYATDFGFIVGFVLVNLSLIKLRASQPNLRRPFKVPLFPLTPILGIVTSALLIMFLEVGTLAIGAELFLLGLLAYYLKMVGNYRLRLALGGINLGISGVAGLLACFIAANLTLVSISSNVRVVLSAVLSLASITCLVAGVTYIITGEEEG